MGNDCTECEMSFSSTKALFGHLRIHRKSNRGVGKRSLLRLGQAKKGEDVLAACILMEMRQSKSKTAIDDAKLSQLRWVCAKIERERRKKMKETVSKHSDNNLGITCRMVSLTPSVLALREHNVDQHMTSNSNEGVKILAQVGAMEVEMHQCDKCDKSFSSGQALGGHKRAHYTGPPLCRPGRDGSLSAVAVAERVLVHHIDLN
ncbi:zinc finger protein ZAT3-like [Phalaenopsis equestris]|uniref:zinc finger protein ZAT3-like n=1 Tax=Phalaenopsis equestris TaxID=78828 RepID=UPI0009E368F0|nr:zinc finger protein ZAT3-like [Phalaenopsis equestris]